MWVRILLLLTLWELWWVVIDICKCNCHFGCPWEASHVSSHVFRLYYNVILFLSFSVHIRKGSSDNSYKYSENMAHTNFHRFTSRKNWILRFQFALKYSNVCSDGADSALPTPCITPCRESSPNIQHSWTRSNPGESQFSTDAAISITPYHTTKEIVSSF